DTKELFTFAVRQDRATKLLTYLADIIVNGHPELRSKGPGGTTPPPQTYVPAPVPCLNDPPSSILDPQSSIIPAGTRDKFLELGPERFAQWVRDQKRLLVTDTTFRDAHQSLLATRMRTFDMLRIAPTYAVCHASLFSLEMWGGATF